MGKTSCNFEGTNLQDNKPHSAKTSKGRRKWGRDDVGEKGDESRSGGGRQAVRRGSERERTQVEKVFKGREMGKGCLERWLPTSSSDAPVTSSGKPTAITHM